jgi:hypothetical protein
LTKVVTSLEREQADFLLFALVVVLVLDIYFSITRMRRKDDEDA